MSINIPAETPDESTNPISVEEFERLHPAHAANTDPSIDSSPNCSARTSGMRDDTDFRRGPGGSPNAARHYTRKGGA